MRWDYADRLYATARQSEQELHEMTYYVYNATGQRVRKVTQRSEAANRNASASTWAPSRSSANTPRMAR